MPASVGALVVLALVAVTLVTPAHVAFAQVPPVIMLVGDSVPEHLTSAFQAEAATRGWEVVSASRGACPVTGEVPARGDGTPIHIIKDCPSVPAAQDALIQQDHPVIIVWWDRFDLHDFLIGERVFRPARERFWAVRERRATAAIDRLGVDGARVVFVAVEPPGVGIRTLCPHLVCSSSWPQYQIDHYRDGTMRWNRILRSIAGADPTRVGFVSVTRIVCHPVPLDRVPCHDRIGGVPARPDGVHYQGAGVPLVVNGLFDLLEPFIL